MDQNSIKRIYEREGRDAALKAYSQAVEENKGQESKMNELAFLAADYAHPEALKFLFSAGVSPSIVDDYSFTLLHHLARQEESNYVLKPEGAVAETTALLLDNNVSALRKDENESMTCYHYAARKGLAEMVETMAKRGTKLNMTDRDGNTGIHIACDYIRHAMTDVEIRKKDVAYSEKNYADTVERCKRNGMSDDDIAQYVNNNMSNPPERARRYYDATVKKVEDYFLLVKAFAEGGVDINEKNSYGKPALDIAVASNAKKIAAYLSGTLTEGDDSTVAAGGMTLHQAAQKGDVEAIKAIAGTGSDLNALNDGEPREMKGCTPLAVAVSNLQADAADALLSFGADPVFKDGNGRMAVCYLFSNMMATVNDNVFATKTIPRIIKGMLSAGLKIDQVIDDDGNTLLIAACRTQRGSMHNRNTLKGEAINETMKNKPNINLANRFGETALMHACAEDFEIMENVQLALLEQGADASAADKNGDTALHYAARNSDKTGARSLCDMLLEFGADAKAVNNTKRTALDIATEQNNEPLVKLLLSKI